jgi:hypothetical protein
MTITYPRSLPSNGKFKTVGWRQIDVTSDMASPFTGASQVVSWPGQWLQCTLTLVAMNRADMQQWDAWIASLKGSVGTFLLPDPLRLEPLGTAALTPLIIPLVAGGGQTGDTLEIDGCPEAETGYLLAGDLFQLGSGSTARIYKLLEDVDTNEYGEAVLHFWPDLRVSPANNAEVTLINPCGLFHRMSGVTDWTNQPGQMTAERSFDVKEKLP